MADYTTLGYVPQQNPALEDLIEKQRRESLQTQAQSLGVPTKIPSFMDPMAQQEILQQRVQQAEAKKQEAERLQMRIKARDEEIRQIARVARSVEKGELTRAEGMEQIGGQQLKQFSPGQLKDLGVPTEGIAMIHNVPEEALGAPTMLTPVGGREAPAQPAARPAAAPSAPRFNPMTGEAVFGQMAQAGRSYQSQLTGAQAMTAAAREAQGTAIDENARLAKEAASANLEAFQQYQRELNAYKSRQEDAKAEIQTKANDQIKKVEDARASLRERKEGYDPNRLFKGTDGTNWGKVTVAAIAMAMGEFGRALTGGSRNMAAEIVNGAIDRDISAQRQEIEDARGEVDQETNMLQLYYNKLGRMDQADLATRMSLKEAYIAKIDAMGLTQAGSRAENDALQLKAQLTAEIAADKERFATLAYQNAQNSVMSGVQGATLMEQYRAAKAEAAGATEQGKIVGMSPTGEIKITKEDVQWANKARPEINNIVDAIDALANHVETYGTEWLSYIPGYDSKAQMKGDQLLKWIYGKIKGPEFLGLGAISGPDLGLIEDITITDPHGLQTQGILQNLSQLKDIIVSGWVTKARQHGLTDNRFGGVSMGQAAQLNQQLGAVPYGQ